MFTLVFLHNHLLAVRTFLSEKPQSFSSSGLEFLLRSEKSDSTYSQKHSILSNVISF